MGVSKTSGYLQRRERSCTRYNYLQWFFVVATTVASAFQLHRFLVFNLNLETSADPKSSTSLSLSSSNLQQQQPAPTLKDHDFKNLLSSPPSHSLAHNGTACSNAFISNCSRLPYLHFLQLLDQETNNNTHANMGTNISCGGHFAPSCAECPQGHGSTWCNGQCGWLASPRDNAAAADKCIARTQYLQEIGCSLWDKLRPLDESLLEINCGNIHQVIIHLPKLGSGDFKNVYRAERHNRTFAVKMMKPDHALPKGYTPLPFPDSPLLEATLMQALRKEPNIMSLYGYCDGTIITELASGNGDLSRLIWSSQEEQGNNNHLSMARRLDLALDVARSVAALHSLPNGPIAHGDLHPGQYVVGQDGNSVVLGDFDTVSFSGHAAHGNDAPVLCEPTVPFRTHWMSPEIFDGAGFTFQSDVFMLANTMWSILVGETLTLRPSDFVEGMRPNLTKIEQLFPAANKNASKALMELLLECWVTKEPKDRPTAGSVVSRIEHVIADVTRPTTSSKLS